MIRKLLLPALLVGLLGGCVTGYGYRDGYYYGQPSVEYRYHDSGYGPYPPYRYAPYRYRYGYPYYGGYYGHYGYPYWYSYPNWYHHRHKPRPPIVNPNPRPDTRPPHDDDDRRPPWRDPYGGMRRPHNDPPHNVVARPQPVAPKPRVVEPRRTGAPMQQPARRAQPRRSGESSTTQEP